jgi:hypothetical protein
MLTKTDTNEFSIYVQKILEVKDGDEYNRLKQIKQRASVVEFFNKVLPTREVIITWSEDGETFSTTATLNTHGYANLAPLPALPETFDDINGTLQPAQKHICFYSKPQMVPVLIDVDIVETILVVRAGIDELLAS